MNASELSHWGQKAKQLPEEYAEVVTVENKWRAYHWYRRGGSNGWRE